MILFNKVDLPTFGRPIMDIKPDLNVTLFS
jgi:hypothetical protein